ncbi:MAG: DUF5615 family PIN-like protein [Candidatus Omnitrophota bacterium]
MSTNKAGKVKFAADECVGVSTITFLRNLGYSVISAKENHLGGKPDFEILKWAIKEERIIITEDLDFGNILLYPPKLHHGIILLRFRHALEDKIHTTLEKLLNELSPKDFKETLIIVDAEKYRLRKEE